jgi:hypothetical protein
VCDVTDHVEIQRVTQTGMVAVGEGQHCVSGHDAVNTVQSGTASHGSCVNPLPAFNMNIHTPNDKWLGTFELPTQVHNMCNMISFVFTG